MTAIRFSCVRRAQQFLPLLFLAAFGAACGGSSSNEGTNDKAGASNGGQVGHVAGAGGSAASSGGVGEVAGSAGSSTGGTGGTGGGSAGAGAVAGMGASAGSIGGAGGSGGDSGSAGTGQAGSAGNTAVCHATPPQPCGGGVITLPRSCVTEAMAAVGTTLSNATCRAMCETMFTDVCSISAVAQSTITVLCNTRCPVQQ
jgi:hypothetical protein